MPVTNPSSRSWNDLNPFKPAIYKCKNFCTSLLSVSFIVLVVLTLLSFTYKSLDNAIHVVLVVPERPIWYKTNPKFLSVALDSVVVANNFKHFNMSEPRLDKLLRALQPGYLRIGGNLADRLFFNPKNKSSKTIFPNQFCNYGESCFVDQNFTMFGDQWLQLNDLATRTGFTVLFDLNALIRYSNGSWNSSNAEQLIKFSDKHNLNVIWELGNEPNAFRHKFGYEVNATQLGKDFSSLRSILNSFPRYKNALLVGPDVTRPVQKHKESMVFLKEFLAGNGKVVDVVTWHQYYFGGECADWYDFVNPVIFDILEEQIFVVKNVVAKSGVIGKPIWLGETSSAYGGGSPLYSNCYISTFIWLDKLGLAAKHGIQLVIRQSISHSYYALIDDNYQPFPDWWISVLYKKIVGPEVLPCYIASSPKVRLYCQCSKLNFDSLPSMTVFGLNMKHTSAKVRLDSFYDKRNNNTAYAYVLTAQNSLLHRNVSLNGKLLKLLPNGDLPELKPKKVNPFPYLKMPPFSSVFWILPSTSLMNCNNLY